MKPRPPPEPIAKPKELAAVKVKKIQVASKLTPVQKPPDTIDWTQRLAAHSQEKIKKVEVEESKKINDMIAQ